MSTRCLIGIKTKSNSIKYIYCHHDGYLSYVGKKLKDFYNNEKSIYQLLELGDLSALGNNPVSKKELWNIDTYLSYPNKDEWCISYNDIGEKTKAKTVVDEKHYISKVYFEEYLYLFKDGEWYVHEVGSDLGFVDYNI